MESDLKPKERFSGLAEDYAKARPDYSDEAIDFILKHCHLKPSDLLVDVGSGTGISSRAFSRRGLKVIGIEPNVDMRRQAEQVNEKMIDSQFQPPVYQDGSAEHTGLPNQSADAVVAAQAFHWFDQEKTLAEFARVLKPGGWVILLWNICNESHLFTKAYSDLIMECGGDLAKIMQTQLKAGEAVLRSNLFREGQKFTFSNEQILDEKGLEARAMSLSYTRENADIKQLMLRRLKDVYKQYAQNELVVLKYSLELYVGRRP